jgi:hypothetical protein
MKEKIMHWLWLLRYRLEKKDYKRVVLLECDLYDDTSGLARSGCYYATLRDRQAKIDVVTEGATKEEVLLELKKLYSKLLCEKIAMNEMDKWMGIRI